MMKNITGRLKNSEPRNIRPQAPLSNESVTTLKEMLPKTSDTTAPLAMEAMIKMPIGSRRRELIQMRRLLSAGATQPAASAQIGDTSNHSSALKIPIGAKTSTTKVGASFAKRNGLGGRLI